MSSLNKIILIGSIEGEPQQRVTNSGDPFATFTLLVDRPERQDGAPVGQDAVDIVAWRDVATKTQSLVSGQLVMVEGGIETRTTDGEDGRKRYFTEVNAKWVHCFSASDPTAGLPAFEPDVSSLESKDVPELTESDFDFQASGDDLSSIEEEVPF